MALRVVTREQLARGHCIQVDGGPFCTELRILELHLHRVRKQLAHRVIKTGLGAIAFEQDAEIIVADLVDHLRKLVERAM